MQLKLNIQQKTSMVKNLAAGNLDVFGRTSRLEPGKQSYGRVLGDAVAMQYSTTAGAPFRIRSRCKCRKFDKKLIIFLQPNPEPRREYHSTLNAAAAVPKSISDVGERNSWQLEAQFCESTPTALASFRCRWWPKQCWWWHNQFRWQQCIKSWNLPSLWCWSFWSSSRPSRFEIAEKNLVGLVLPLSRHSHKWKHTLPIKVILILFNINLSILIFIFHNIIQNCIDSVFSRVRP